MTTALGARGTAAHAASPARNPGTPLDLGVLTRTRINRSAVGPSVGNQKVSAYQDRGSGPSTSSTGSGHGFTRTATGTRRSSPTPPRC